MARYRLVQPDQWRHSVLLQLPVASRDLAALAHDHLALMDHLGSERFAVASLLVGGMWGVHLAAAYPGRVIALVLMDTGLGGEHDLPRPPEEC